MTFQRSENFRKDNVGRNGMRGRYLVRSNKAVVALTASDALLRILQRRVVAIPREVSRIVVANGAHLGDVLLTLPAIVALRQAYPDAKIAAVVGSWARPVAEWSGLFDEIYVFDHWRHIRSSKGRLNRYRSTRISTLRALRANRYQIGIDFYPFFPPTHPLFYQAGIPIRIGFESGGFGPLLTHRVPWRNADIPFTELLSDLLVKCRSDPKIRTVSEFRIQRSVTVPSPLKPGNYVVLHPGAGASYKEWGTDHWHNLALRLRARGETTVVTGAGSREREISESLCEVIDVNLVDGLSWDEFAGVIGGAKAVICPDTVTGHLAAIYAIPTVAIFTGTNNVHHWAPRNSNAVTLSQPVQCAPCYQKGCYEMTCIRSVSVDSVLSALDFVLKNSKAREETKSID